MQGAGDHFLAAAGLAEQQYRQVVEQTLAGHAQGAGIARVGAGQGFQARAVLRRAGGYSRRYRQRMAAQRRLQRLVEQFALGCLDRADTALGQARQQLLAAHAEEFFAAPAHQRLALHAEQLAGLAADRQHLAIQAQRQQALPGGIEELPTVMEGQHDLPGITDGEQPRLDLADRQAEQRQAFARTGERAFAGHVEHAE
ncbi:hypothetical protein D3C76_681880 [compost metagenome]